MKSKLYKIYTAVLFTSFAGFYGNVLIAQEDLQKEVQVVKPYEPAISDAFKNNSLPVIVDTLKVESTFEYQMKTFPINIDYETEPIKAAQMIGEPLKKLYSGYAKFGFGNYVTPFIDLRYTSKYSKKFMYEANFTHLSSSGKTRNSKKRRIFSGFSDNLLNLTGKRIFEKKSLTGNIKYNNTTDYFYGYNPLNTYDPIPPYQKKNMDKQRINAVKGRLNLQSNYLDSSRVNYDLALSYGYMQEINKISEQNIDLDISLDYFFENEFVGIDTRISNYLFSSDNQTALTDIRASLDVPTNTLVQFNPWVGAFGKKWQVVAGLNTYYLLEDKSEYKLYPKLKLHYNIIDYFLIPYFEFQGMVDVNSYEKLLTENPYYVFPFKVDHTKQSLLTGGFRGNFSPQMSFNFRVNYADIKDMYFFINDTAYNQQENRFTIVSDDLTMLSLFGEISYKSSEKLNFLVKANYNVYDLETLEKPWHKPQFEASFYTKYNIKNKVILDANVFAIGKRYAREFNPVEKTVELDALVDLNLGVEYRYTKILSGFIRVNNIGAAKYYQWNYYPTHRINIMFGVTYSL